MTFIIFSSLTISLFIFYTRTLIHELGHVLALVITKKILHYNKSLGLKFCIFPGSGRTESYLYEYLSKIKKEKKYQFIIRINAASGIIMELIYYINLIITSVYNFLKNYCPIINLVIICSVSTLIILLIFSINNTEQINDFKIIKSPIKFDYTYNKNFKVISLKILLKSFTLNIYLFSFIITIIALIFYLITDYT